MITRNGVYYDLNYSTYKFTVDGLTFIFSSDLHQFKFEDKVKENRKELSAKLKARYNLNIKFNTLADVLLYSKIETRGFLIKDEKGFKLCKENLILSGERLTLKS